MRALALVVSLVAACSFSARGADHADASGDTSAGPDTPAGFDPTKCPAIYHPIGSYLPRYSWGRVPTTAQITLPMAAQLCAGDQGAGPSTHVVVFASQQERDDVWHHVAPDINYNFVWEGVYASGAQWPTILGGTYAPQWAPGDPLATRMTGVSNGIVVGDKGGNMYGDIEWPVLWAANVVCECDGRQVVANVPAM